MISVNYQQNIWLAFSTWGVNSQVCPNNVIFLESEMATAYSIVVPDTFSTIHEAIAVHCENTDDLRQPPAPG